MKQEPMCVVTFGYQAFVMTVEDGAELFRNMHGARQVESVYAGETPYKFSTSDSGITMKHLPWEDYNKMCALHAAALALAE